MLKYLEVVEIKIIINSNFKKRNLLNLSDKTSVCTN